VATETRDKCEVEVEDVLKPLNGGSGLVCEDLDQVWAGLVASRLEGVIVELLDTVANLVIDLGSCEGTIDAGGGLRRVAAEEAWFGSAAHSTIVCRINRTLLV
jgi:hypothetical protein